MDFGEAPTERDFAMNPSAGEKLASRGIATQEVRVMSERSDTSARRDLIPEPDVVERVICGERVAVKCYPPMSDPRWAAWIRDKVRSNSGGFDSDSIFD